MLKPRAALAAIALALAAPANAADDARAKFVTTPTGYLMVLRRGDDVIASIEKLAEEQKIPSASLTGIGFLSDVTFGFFDFGKKEFQPKTFHDVEMASMTGTIAWKDGKPSVHAHAAAAGRDFNAVGGHVLAAKVGPGSVEVSVVVHDKQLQRLKDPGIGANVLQLD
jgi:predicted DNA-binding protein with PD1-like motif